ncbi:MAG: tRNA (guanosine(46)-N(7))-methyltransferase TrmB [Phycisphaerae bacterium]|nr:hypothetical protein [Tepidisphaeraceae bacterium]
MSLPRSNYAHRLAESPELIPADPFALRAGWADYFRARIGPAFGGEVTLEIGCFDAELVAKVAPNHPGRAFVGLDWKAKAIHDGARRLTELGVANVALVRARGQDLPRLFSPGEVGAIWVFHPDPFDGPDELKHRLVTPAFLRDVHAALQPGGRLILKTDHAEYFGWVMAQLAAVGPLFDIVHSSADYAADPIGRAAALAHPFGPHATMFERRFVARGQAIAYLEAVRRPTVDE